MLDRSTIRRAAGGAAAALAALVFAAGCGGDTSHDGGHSSPSAGASAQAATDHNDADVTFAQNMIPHHQQAVEMAVLAETRASDPKVKALAARIKQAQQPEIDQMTGWLTQWGAPTTAPTAGGGHSGHGSMAGMMSDADMAAMHSANGVQFDRMFLEMMIRHHQGAVQMAGTEQQQGRNTAAKELAARIESSQNDEIAQMNAMLANR